MVESRGTVRILQIKNIKICKMKIQHVVLKIVVVIITHVVSSHWLNAPRNRFSWYLSVMTPSCPFLDLLIFFVCRRPYKDGPGGECFLHDTHKSFATRCEGEGKRCMQQLARFAYIPHTSVHCSTSTLLAELCRKLSKIPVWVHG
jgi:hypothetical protein